MIFKSFFLEQNLQTISKYKMFLFYGENQGLKKDFKEKLREKNKNLEILNFFQDEIIKKKDLLYSEVTNKSLFSNEKIIFIDQSNEKIFETIKELEKIIEDEKIYIFADLLDKKSKLREYFEKSKICGIVPCYKDNEISIKKMILNKLKDYQLLTPQIINLIIQSTGLDRSKVNNEIEKIKSCYPDKKIDASNIESLLNITSNDDFNLLKDEALIGNRFKTNKLLGDTVFEAENIIYYLNSINQRINKLNEIENLKVGNSSIDALLDNIKPPIFWKDKPILIEQSKKWNKKNIQNALNKTYKAEIEIKSNSAIRKDLIIKKLILDLCSTASIS